MSKEYHIVNLTAETLLSRCPLVVSTCISRYRSGTGNEDRRESDWDTGKNGGQGVGVERNGSKSDGLADYNKPEIDGK